MPAISVSRYPGWWFGVSSKSRSHSTKYRRPLLVFLVAIIVPILRSATSRGVLTHTLSPGLSFSTLPPPLSGIVAHSFGNDYLQRMLRIYLVYNILYTSSQNPKPVISSFRLLSLNADYSSGAMLLLKGESPTKRGRQATRF